MENIKTYTVDEAESILKVKARTIRAYIKAGKLKASKIGRSYVIQRADLEQFIKENS
jgi:excisionase family DNA binding protein